MTQAPPTPLSYEQSGVQYELIDPLKVAAQRAAAATGVHLGAHGFTEVPESRGESAYVLDVGPFYLASIVECLGTKTLVADEMQRLTGRSWFAGIAQDTLAMAINDLITVGATPLVVQAYWAAGGSDWFADAERAQALVAGWKAACDACQVAWGGGETPALAGIVEAGRIDLAASCTGLVKPRGRLTLGREAGPRGRHRPAGLQRHPRQRPEPGAQAGRTAARGLPDRDRARAGLRRGPAGTHYAVRAGDRSVVVRAGVRVHYAANITGHGWRKLLRHPKALRYRVQIPCRRCRRCCVLSSSRPLRTPKKPTAR
jgi:phosphoribosylformylglycinamidine cyclo-ligase